MKKEIAEILAEKGQEIVGRAFVQSPSFIESRVLFVEVQLETGTNEYSVNVGIETYSSETCIPIPGSYNYLYFMRNFYLMTFEDKLRILYMEAAKKFETLRNSVDQWNLLMQALVTGDRSLYNKNKFQLYRDWQEAQNEYHNLFCFVRKQNIDPKNSWL